MKDYFTYRFSIRHILRMFIAFWFWAPSREMHPNVTINWMCFMSLDQYVICCQFAVRFACSNRYCLLTSSRFKFSEIPSIKLHYEAPKGTVARIQLNIEYLVVILTKFSLFSPPHTRRMFESGRRYDIKEPKRNRQRDHYYAARFFGQNEPVI